MKFKRLTPKSRGPNTPEGSARWWCDCDCGNPNQTLVLGFCLRNGNTRSCGCLHIDAAERRVIHGHARNGTSHTSSEYVSWQEMKRRCLKLNCPGYERYGGAGITVCERWLGANGFINFIADMGLKPTPRHTIDRIDSKGNYEPSNCRWATHKEQHRNTSFNVNITIDGVTKCLWDWSVFTGVKFTTISGRLKIGWDVRTAIFTPASLNAKRRKRGSVNSVERQRTVKVKDVIATHQLKNQPHSVAD